MKTNFHLLNFIKAVFISALAILIASCSPKGLLIDLGLPDSQVFSGSILNFSSLSISASSSCPTEKAHFYSLTSDGEKNQLLASSAVSSNGSFSFTGLESKGVSASASTMSKTSYLIEYTCNNVVYRRYVSDYANQNLSQGTTLLTWLSNTDIASLISQKPASYWTDYYKLIEEESSLADAYAKLSSDTNLSSEFLAEFGKPISVLLEATPIVETTTIPASFNEEVAQNISVSFNHWSGSYNRAQEWRKGTDLLSTSATFSYTPKANDQGPQTVKLIWGQDDGFGQVDRTKHYQEKEYTFQVANSILPSAPPMVLLTDSETNLTAAQVRMSTGVISGGIYPNCKSFSHLALVEEAYPAIGIAPLLPSAYTISCTTGTTQDINLTLSGTQGQRVLRLWARDAAGITSLVSSNADVLYDITAPAINLTSLTGGQMLVGGASAVISWTMSDLFPATNPITLQYSTNAGTSWTNIASSLSNSGSYTWSVPAIDTTQLRVQVSAIDLAGNTASSSSASNLTIDSTLPTAPVFTRSTAQYSNSTSVGLSVTCDADYAAVLFTQSASTPLANDSGWVACTASPNFTVSTGDGTKTIYAWSKDAAGNISASSNNVTMVLDQTNPTITLTNAPATPQKASAAFSINFNVTEVNITNAQSFTVQRSDDNGSSWSNLGTVTSTNGPLSAQSFSYNTTWPASELAAVRYRITATDLAGNTTTTSSSSFIVDNAKPTIVASSFKLNGSATPATAPNVNFSVEFSSADSISNVKQFCMKYNSTVTPLDSDSCWINVTALGLSEATTLNVTLAQNYFFQTGYGIGTYDVYLWVKDAAGHISDLTNTGTGTIGTDYIEATYDPGTPPSITSLTANSVDNPSNPNITSDLQTPAGTNVFVRWRITDDYALPAGSIQLSYLNPATGLWVAISGASALNNSANGACTADDPATATVETGCFAWASGSPTNDAYQIRLIVTDSATQSNQATTAPLNTDKFRIIAGNMDPGLNGNARTAMFFPRGGGEQVYTRAFVVAPNGNVFLHDPRGILRIKPADGVVRLFISKTGANAGANGPASSMTVADVYAMTLDQSGRVLFMTNDGIYRFASNEDDPTVTRVVGGGGSSADGVTPDQVLLNSTRVDRQLFTTSNGNIYFSIDFDLRYYQASDNKVYTVQPSGLGHHISASVDVSTANCPDKSSWGASFDLNTSALTSLFYTTNSYHTNCGNTPGTPIVNLDPITFASKGFGMSPINHPTPHWSYSVRWAPGVNGDLIGVGLIWGAVYKYDIATNTLNKIAGTTARGYCEDGVQALSCAITPQDAFVDKFGKVYILDAGRIRTIQPDGTMLTLYGAWKSDGNGSSALTARSTYIHTLSQSSDGKIQLLNAETNLIREFTIGGNINTIAGTGNYGNIVGNSTAASNPIPGEIAWGGANSFVTDPATGDIYMGVLHSVFKLDRSTGLWSNSTVIGNGATDHRSGDGIVGANLLFNGWIKPAIFAAGKVVLALMTHWGVPGNEYGLKAYDSLDSFKQTNLLGNTEITSTATTHCADGLTATSCYFSQDEMVIYTNMYSYDPVDDKYLAFFKFNSILIRKSDNTLQLVTLPTVGGRIYNFAYRRKTGTPDTEYIYWTEPGTINRYNLTTSTNQVLYTLPLNMTSTTGGNMIWDETRKKIIFPVVQNWLSGVAEYYDP